MINRIHWNHFVFGRLSALYLMKALHAMKNETIATFDKANNIYFQCMWCVQCATLKRAILSREIVADEN